MLGYSHWPACVVLLGVVVGLPTRAHAVPEFPRAITRNLSLDYEPPCSICHIKDNTGVGTANTPFALAMRERGLDTGNQSTLTTALTTLKQDGVDSDGDGVGDVEELVNGTDPNSEAPVSIKDQVTPTWGCALAPQSPPAAPGGVVSLGVALWLVRRCRRRSANR